ncbi:hypothetical protein ACET3Z_025213 [Daucus carota]
MGTKRPEKKHLAKQNTLPLALARKGYRLWSTQMDAVLTSTLFQQINEGNKGDGDFKPQALQAVVYNLKAKFSISLTLTHETWKRHYSMIIDIRNYTKITLKQPLQVAGTLAKENAGSKRQIIEEAGRS